MTQPSLLLQSLLSLLVLAGCVGGSGVTREQARLMGGRGADGTDLCASEGFYGDGVCDSFCPSPDEDCGACPDASDPAVRYVFTDVSACAAALFACEPGETLFSDECGCGCEFGEGGI